MTVKWTEPTSSEDWTPKEFCISDEEAIHEMRRSFKYTKPYGKDPRTDAECLEDFIIIYWAEHIPE